MSRFDDRGVTIRIAPSILSADFAWLGRSISEATDAGADWVHVDVMDGHFVPNLTIGPPVVKALKRISKLPLDVHLMIERPEDFIDAFADAGADWLTVHVEACRHLHRAITRIRDLGMHPGVALNPATPVHLIDEILPYVDLVLIMTVNPGFGGQSFVPTSPEKVARVRDMIERRGLWGTEIQVDGGIDPETAPLVLAAGATVLVAGSAIFNDEASVEDNIEAMRDAITRATQRSRRA